MTRVTIQMGYTAEQETLGSSRCQTTESVAGRMDATQTGTKDWISVVLITIVTHVPTRCLVYASKFNSDAYSSWKTWRSWYVVKNSTPAELLLSYQKPFVPDPSMNRTDCS